MIWRLSQIRGVSVFRFAATTISTEHRGGAQDARLDGMLLKNPNADCVCSVVFLYMMLALTDGDGLRTRAIRCFSWNLAAIIGSLFGSQLVMVLSTFGDIFKTNVIVIRRLCRCAILVRCLAEWQLPTLVFLEYRLLFLLLDRRFHRV